MKFIDLGHKQFFTYKGEVFQKNGPMSGIHVTNPILGERYFSPMDEKYIEPYNPAVTPKVVDPEKFETKVVERPEVDGNFGATTVTVTPADSKIEPALQPSRKKAKKKKENE